MDGDARDCRVARTFLATISMVRCGGSRAVESTSSHRSRRARCAAGERGGIRVLDTPDVSGNKLCGRYLRNAHIHIHPRRYVYVYVYVYVSGSGATHTRQGERAYPASTVVHILAATTQVQDPPPARTDSRELGGECTSVHILIVGASRVARIVDPAVQTAEAVRPPEIRVNPRRLREIRRVFDFSKALHRRCFSGGLAPDARRPPRLNA